MSNKVQYRPVARVPLLGGFLKVFIDFEDWVIDREMFLRVLRAQVDKECKTSSKDLTLKLTLQSSIRLTLRGIKKIDDKMRLFRWFAKYNPTSEENALYWVASIRYQREGRPETLI